MHTEFLFWYGTLQLEAVQVATFGRQLPGATDALRGFELVFVKIENQTVVALSGKAHHTMATFTGRASDVVSGTVFAVTPAEIQKADKYEEILSPLCLFVGSRSIEQSDRHIPTGVAVGVPGCGASAKP